MSLEAAAIFALVALLVGFSKGGLGGPVPVSLTAPLLSLVIPTRQAIGVILPLLMFADMFALYFYWRKWDIRYIRVMLPAAIVGIVLGTWLLGTLPNDVLKRVVGGFTLVAVLYKFSTDYWKSLEYQPRQWHGYFAGWASGFASALANAGGPPFTAYLLLQTGVTPITFVGTTTLFFAVVNWIKLPGVIAIGALDLHMLLSIAWIAPIIPFGVWAGRAIVRRMDAKFFERLMLFMLFLLSLSLLFS